jgi:hypothetical protein
MAVRLDPAGLLALRDWIVEWLGTDDPCGGEVQERAVSLPVETWRAFLTMERCALEARSALARAPDVPPALARLVEATAQTELQRFLSAAGQIRRIAEITRETGTRVVVLKGGVAVLAGHPTAIDDLDLLVPASSVAAVSGALDRAGYATWGPDMPSTPPLRFEANEVPVDLHRSIDGIGDAESILARARGIPSLPGVFRPRPDDHLWHLLVHVSHHHPDRRGRIRDLPLLARAVTECDASALVKVAARIAGHNHPHPMEAHLEMARRIAARKPVVDRFRDLAWTKYDAAARLAWLDGGEKARLLRMHVIRSLCAGRPLVDEVRELGERRPGVVPLLRRSAAFVVAGLMARWVGWRQRREGKAGD